MRIARWRQSSADALSEHSCDCTLELKLRADWHPTGLAQPPQQPPLLAPWPLRATVCFRIEWPQSMDAGSAAAPAEPIGLHIDGSASLGALCASCTGAQLSHFANLKRMAAHPNVAHAHRNRRPRARPFEHLAQGPMGCVRVGSPARRGERAAAAGRRLGSSSAHGRRLTVRSFLFGAASYMC